jgi:hypothetical protein
MKLRRETWEERKVWLENFDPWARPRFFYNCDLKQAVFLRGFSRELGMEQEEAAPLLERVGNERKWMKLRTKDGMVVGIAPRKKGRAFVRYPGRAPVRSEHEEAEAAAWAEADADETSREAT